MPTFCRILLVEDFEPFRRLLRGELDRKPEFYIIGEVSDGLSAVQQAKELQPDLVLIDIGLPKLNGIEAARRIRHAAPQAKLLFVSSEISSDIVRETFRLGALGYIDKMQVKLDLLPALEAVLDGKRFISSSLDFTDDQRRHDVLFCSDDTAFIEGTAAFIVKALRAGDPAIVLASEAHREALVQRLNQSVDIDSAIEQGRYIALDAAESISHIMVNGLPDRGLFLEAVRHQIERASMNSGKEHPRVAIFGECAGILCAAGNMDAAIQLEKTGNDLIKSHNVDILCGYSLNLFHDDGGNGSFKSLCAEHTSVYSR